MPSLVHNRYCSKIDTGSCNCGLDRLVEFVRSEADCRCDEAYTGRGLHEPNTNCVEAQALLEEIDND